MVRVQGKWWVLSLLAAIGLSAGLLAARFRKACRRHGLNEGREKDLETRHFVADPGAPSQGELFS